MDRLARQEQAKYRRMWGVPDYRRHSPGLQLAPAVWEHFGRPQCGTLIDYGCGEGRAMDWFAERGLEVSGVDLVALRPDVVEATLWDLPDNGLLSDYAYCADVLEHIPESRVYDALLGMWMRTEGMAALSVATVDCTVGRRHGEQLHLTVEPVEWWDDVIGDVWDAVERFETDRDWRHLYICWDEE